MSTAGPRLERPIQIAIDATNKGDNNAFVATFTKDGAVNDWGHVHSGRSEISAWDKEENTGTGRKLKVTGVSRLADEVLVLLQITERSEQPKGKAKAGDEDVEDEAPKSTSGTFSFRLRGDKIETLEIG